jgi:hypothetical protein
MNQCTCTDETDVCAFCAALEPAIRTATRTAICTCADLAHQAGIHENDDAARRKAFEIRDTIKRLLG